MRISRCKRILILLCATFFFFQISLLLMTYIRDKVNPFSIVSYVCGKNCSACNLGSNEYLVDSTCYGAVLQDSPSSNSVCIEPNFTLPDLTKYFSSTLKVGGTWKPPLVCKKNSGYIAIVIPFRNRWRHLTTLLYRLHSLLPRQGIHYTIYVIEQDGSTPFNRGMIKNIGFVEAKRLNPTHDCVFFHDVDLIPEDNRNLYHCPTSHPKHHVMTLNKWNYRNCYSNLVGGVLAMNNNQFEMVNGFSNLFFNWGSEDDDLYLRLRHYNLRFSGLHPFRYGRYFMLPHSHDEENFNRLNLLKNSLDRMSVDGLNNLKYQVLDRTKRTLYTYVRVHIDQDKVFDGFNIPNRTSYTFMEHQYWNWNFGWDWLFIWNKLTGKC